MSTPCSGLLDHLPPIPWQSMIHATIGDTCYFMGGICKNVGGSHEIYSASLEALVSHSASDNSDIWRKLPPLNCTQSCSLSLGGSLLAVGGLGIKDKHPISAIQQLDLESNTWVKVGQLPYAVYNCSCIMSSDKIFVMGGHDGRTSLKKLFYSEVQKLCH